MRQDIEKYLVTGQVVEMIYLDRRGFASKRKIRLYSLQGNHVKAYCLTRKAYRIFLLDHILAIYPVQTRSVV